MSESNNSRYVSVRPNLSHQLKKAAGEKYESVRESLEKWWKDTDCCGSPPSVKEIIDILHSSTRRKCKYDVINGLCQVLLERPHRDNSNTPIPPLLKQSLTGELERRYQVGGKRSWTKLSNDWSERLRDAKSPVDQTLRNFFEPDRKSCEHWLLDGLCWVLLDCSWEDWQNDNPEMTAPRGQLPIPSTPSLDCDIEHWVGRDTLVRELLTALMGDCQVLALLGMTGIGKTALAMKLMREPRLRQRLQTVKVVSFDRDLPAFEVVSQAILGEGATHDQESEKDVESAVRRTLAQLRSQPYLLILDMLETILESDGEGGHRFCDRAFARFFDEAIRWKMPSRIIVTSQHQLPPLAEGRYRTRTHNQRLSGLTETEALLLFRSWGIQTQPAGLSFLERIIAAYEGHPLALRTIAGEMRESPYNGDIRSYWHDFGREIETVEAFKTDTETRSRDDKPRLDRYSPSLKDFVKTRIEGVFRRLYASHPLAYLLLCAGAVERQGIEREHWLFLIGDRVIDREQQIAAFETLQRRFLLESEKTEHKTLYRLHPLIRRVALDHLEDIDDEFGV